MKSFGAGEGRRNECRAVERLGNFGQVQDFKERGPSGLILRREAEAGVGISQLLLFGQPKTRGLGCNRELDGELDDELGGEVTVKRRRRDGVRAKKPMLRAPYRSRGTGSRRRLKKKRNRL